MLPYSVSLTRKICTWIFFESDVVLPYVFGPCIYNGPSFPLDFVSEANRKDTGHIRSVVCALRYDYALRYVV